MTADHWERRKWWQFRRPRWINKGPRTMTYKITGNTVVSREEFNTP